ncbi:hypothetical protein [Methylomonas koyamae]|uniref:Uncharacterized protein n=1 Tax=Methylomonas koyamae TaxID=702114 RepID=A0A291IHU2_9GAMM|nr:hypothetical protein [Methylomonas koyamae]ATG89740.1 hypothetical protein MKLM6_1492 [Methylomonas koyamae]OAI24770.1 hypothetical protein A1356_14845 [Methylomonas koyamae]
MKIEPKSTASKAGKRPAAKTGLTASERRLRQALDRIAALEQRLATLEQVIRIAADGSVSITSAANLEINANQAVINAASVKAANVIQCDTLIANNVVASTYTPGAGNIW